MSISVVYKSKTRWYIPPSVSSTPVFNVITRSRKILSGIPGINDGLISIKNKRSTLSFVLPSVAVGVRNIYLHTGGAFTNTVRPDIKRNGTWIGSGLIGVYVRHNNAWVLVWSQ